MKDGENVIFKIHCTRQPLSKSDVTVANIIIETEYILLKGTVETDEIWKEISDSEELVQLLLELNAEHIRQSTIGGTHFSSGPPNQLF